MNIIRFKKLGSHLMLIILSICYLVILFPTQICVASQKKVNIAGLWRSNINLEYKIFQNNTNFTWDVIGRNQKANGTINGLKVSASWQGQKGMASASGTIHLDPLGRAIAIKWSNGVVFKRDLPPERGGQENQTSKPSEVRLGDKTVEHQTIKKAITPGQIGRPFVYDHHLISKTTYSAVLSVGYNYSPPSVSQPQFYCKIFANGRQVGRSLGWIPFEKSPNGRVLIPIEVYELDVLTGQLAGPGNESQEIEFILKEKKKPNQLKITYPFRHQWGDDDVTYLGGNVTPHQQNKMKVKFSFFCSIDPRHFNQDRAHLGSGPSSIEMWVIPFFQGREIINAKSNINIISITHPSQLADTFHNIFSTEFISTNGHCDEVRIFLQFYHKATGKEIFLRKILKVNL